MAVPAHGQRNQFEQTTLLKGGVDAYARAPRIRDDGNGIELTVDARGTMQSRRRIPLSQGTYLYPTQKIRNLGNVRGHMN